MSYKKINHGFLVNAYIIDNDNSHTYDLSNSILDIIVKKDYLNSSMPGIVIDLRTTEEYRNIIRDNNCSISLRISDYSNDKVDISENADSTDVAEEDLLFETTIRIYEKPFTTTTSKKEEDMGDSDIQSQATSAPFIYYRVVGIPENIISKNESIINNVYKNAETSDALVHMLSSVDKISNFYIQETDNKFVYRNIIIPPLSLIPAINHLQEFYNVYTEGLNLFLDFNSSYCYSMLSSKREPLNILECNVLSAESTADLTEIGLPAVDENNNIKLNYKNLPTFSNSKEIVDHKLGNETIFYSYDDYFNISYRNKTNADTFKKVRYIWNTSGLKISEDGTHSIINNSSHINIVLNNINPELFNPLTSLRLISSEYKKIEGDYGIVSCSYMFNTSDFKHYSNSVYLEFVKVK